MAVGSDGDGEFVTLVVTQVVDSDGDSESRFDHEELILCTADIDYWDVRGIVHRSTVKIRAFRSRLMEESSYFRGLLGGSFSESQQEVISVEWNLETLIDVLKHVFGCPLTISCANLISLIECSLYFGIVTLLSRCKDWFIQATYCKETTLFLLPLDDVINLWKFCVEHGIDPFPELCTSFLARNFMLVASSQFLPAVPCNLLTACLLHEDLTVDSEMHLAEALVNWLDAMWNRSESCSKEVDIDCIQILKEIRVVLLPLQFAIGMLIFRLLEKYQV
ncbi:hypothetical protein MLD38_022593 [Melastoma candidum]|uniref:Uncharacterized protein n=1 Tax=Melastoma candidum TaxID=119954 RepID=A0ACB9QKY6_9MYRT|nr:hypothetical protein MLD38_022593 [Melastoma candidum]